MCETWLVCGGLSGIICDMVFALVWASTDTRWEFLAAPSVGGTPGFGVCLPPHPDCSLWMEKTSHLPPMS